jgi:ZIP family zinc transporter
VSEADFLTIVGIAGAAAVASPIGGLIALWVNPTTLFMSLALGFASGVLLGTVAFSMLPEALRLASLPIAVGGFSTGFLAMYAFDLFIHRGQLAGKEAEERPQVERFYTRSNWRAAPAPKS